MRDPKNIYSIDVVYSPDDGGYYAEVVDVRTGVTFHTTDVYRSGLMAYDRAAKCVASWQRSHEIIFEAERPA
jgi:hypothetical protein